MVEEPRGRLGPEGLLPQRQEGHLLKKRKWPLKGWHKVGVGPGEGLSRMDVEVGQGKCRVQRRKGHVCDCSPSLFLSLSLGPAQRYFVLEDGILHYATTRQDVSWGPVAGRATEASGSSNAPLAGCSVLSGSWFPLKQGERVHLRNQSPPEYACMRWGHGWADSALFLGAGCPGTQAGRLVYSASAQSWAFLGFVALSDVTRHSRILKDLCGCVT